MNKKGILIVLLFILTMPVMINASVSYESGVDKSKNYIKRISGYDRFILTNIESGFEYGGLLSKEEFNITKVNGKSYLAIGPQYWLKQASNNKKYVVDFSLREVTNELFSGVRVTEYIKPNVKVIGKGTQSQPWEFIGESYIVKYNANGGTGNMQQTTYEIDKSVSLPLNTFTRSGYIFDGWSTSSSTIPIIYDSKESTGSKASDEEGYNDFKQYRVNGPFSFGDVYQLDVDVKGSGNLRSFFYGDSGYLQIASWEASSGKTGTSFDGNNGIPLTNEYTHYTVRFTLGSTGDGSVSKTILFRAQPGCTASIKNVRLYKVDSSTKVYMNQASVKNLSIINGATVTLYAQWIMNTTPPTCTCSKSNLNTSTGVTVTVSCTDKSGSGCVNDSQKYTGVKSNQTYSCKDNNGNESSCSVEVQSYCSTYKSCQNSSCNISGYGTCTCRYVNDMNNAASQMSKSCSGYGNCGCGSGYDWYSGGCKSITYSSCPNSSCGCQTTSYK